MRSAVAARRSEEAMVSSMMRFASALGVVTRLASATGTTDGASASFIFSMGVWSILLD